MELKKHACTRKNSKIKKKIAGVFIFLFILDVVISSLINLMTDTIDTIVDDNSVDYIVLNK